MVSVGKSRAPWACSPSSKSFDRTLWLNRLIVGSGGSSAGQLNPLLTLLLALLQLDFPPATRVVREAACGPPLVGDVLRE